MSNVTRKNYYEWSLPFTQRRATKRFSEKTFHQCSATGFNSKGVVTYDCEKTVFFLDKPEAIIVTTQDTMDYDETIFYSGNMLESIPAGTDVDELIEDSQLDVFIIEDSIDLDKTRESFKKFKSAIVSNDVSEEVINDLNAIGFAVIKQGSRRSSLDLECNECKTNSGLTEGITNEDVSDVSQAQLFSTLRISGCRENMQDALASLEELNTLRIRFLPTIKVFQKNSFSSFRRIIHVNSCLDRVSSINSSSTNSYI